MRDAPAYSIETSRCLLRCFEPRDAHALHDLVTANVEHLAPWLEWAREEPLPLAARVQLLRTFRRRFDADEDLVYGVFERGTSRLLGSVGLHNVAGEPHAATVGYWFGKADTGRGLATEAVSAVVRAAFEVQRIARLEIHCDATNVRSRALAKRLGFQLDAELRERGHAPGLARAVHSLLASEYPESPAANLEATAFDALGAVLFEPPPRNSAFR